MKKSIFTLMFCLLVSISGFAQVKKIIIDIYGNFGVVVKVREDAFVTISQNGDVLNTDINGSFYYNGSGRISSVGNISFYYNSSGTISSIGNISFYYNSSGTISSIGNKSFYYNGSGKVSSIGNTSFYYNSSGNISSIGNNSFYYNGSGKLSSGNTSFIDSGISFRVTGGN